jgi:hypothetical protein
MLSRSGGGIRTASTTMAEISSVPRATAASRTVSIMVKAKPSPATATVRFLKKTWSLVTMKIRPLDGSVMKAPASSWP